MATLPRYIQNWTRELLGAHGCVRVFNTATERRKIDTIIEAIESGKVTAPDVRAAFNRAATSRKPSLDDVLKLLKGVGCGAVQRPAAAVPAAASAPIVPPVEIQALQRELDAFGQKVNDLEELTRALTERAVLDAVRIQGLEAVIMAMANGSGIGPDAERVYRQTTSQYLSRRMPLLKRRTA